MAIKELIKIKYFENIKEMPLYNYVKFLDTNDIKYFSTYHDVIFSYSVSYAKLKESSDNILNELVKDNQFVIDQIEKLHKLEKLRIKFNDVNRLIDNMLLSNTSTEVFQDLRKQLLKWGYKVNIDINLKDNLLKIKHRTQSLISDAKSLQNEIKKSSNKEKIEIEELIFIIEQGLELRYKINTKKTTLFEWQLLQKKYEKKIDLLKKQNTNGSN